MRLSRLARAASLSAASFAMALLTAPAAQAADLIAIGTLSGSTDLSGLSGMLENGVNANNVLGGIGSGLAWAGGNTFLALPDRGPNAATYAAGAGIDNTTSYIARFQTVTLGLSATPSGGLPYTLTPTLTGTTLLASSTALNYGSTAGLPSGVPSANTAGKNYFTGRSDGFAAGSALGSLNPDNARLDPEGIRVSNDGKKVYVSDEYGPYVYEFDRATGLRTKTFALPGNLAASNLSSAGAAEISGNTSGRVANKGMEGLAITPDGKTLVGFVQSPLIQDGGDGGRANRIVTIDIASGAAHEYAYDNIITTGSGASATSKAYNSSEIVALNATQMLVLERDGKGLGDGSNAKVKQVWAVDLAGAADVSALSGESTLLAHAPAKKLFLDVEAAMKAFGMTEAQIPAKLEGLAFGSDIVDAGVTYHTLYVANDNDFLPGVAGDNKFYVFRFTDAELAAKGLGPYVPQSISAVPEAQSWVAMAGGLSLLLWTTRSQRSRRR